MQSCDGVGDCRAVVGFGVGVHEQGGAQGTGQGLVGEPDGPGQVGLDIRCWQPHHAEDVGEHLVAEQAAVSVGVQAGDQVAAPVRAEGFDVVLIGQGTATRASLPG